LLGLIAAHAAYEQASASITAAQLLALLQTAQPPVQLLVAEQAGELAGYAALTVDFSLWRASRWAHLDCLYVKAGLRGAGIGRQLLGYACKQAKTLGADRLEWQTPHWNSDAVRFYEREGGVCVDKKRFWLALD
jgi:GNAT superfamily N-acetyltransferase